MRIVAAADLFAAASLTFAVSFSLTLLAFNSSCLPFFVRASFAVFVPFAVVYMGQPLKLDYLWAGICLTGAVYFMFRS